MADRIRSRNQAEKHWTPAIPSPASPDRTDRLPTIDASGVVYVPDVTVRPSDLWSAAFRRFYARSSSPSEDSLAQARPLPGKTAPKAEWDDFDAWFEEHYMKRLFIAALRRYPVNIVDTSLAGVSASIVTPKRGIAKESSSRVLINLHGGGFVVGRGLRAGQVESIPVAALGRIKVVTLDYRQAPFHRHPAACEDVEAVYLELLKQYRPESIGIYGCSAGGVLAAQTIARFQGTSVTRPGAVGIFSMAPPPPYTCAPPWDPSWGDSGVWFSGSPRNHPSEEEKAAWDCARWYMEGASLDDRSAYPGAFDEVLAQFPPTLFLSGTRDFAMSTIVAANARFLRLGVDASLYLMEGAPHAAHINAVDTPEAHCAHMHVARWFTAHLA